MQNRDTAILSRTKTLLQQGWTQGQLARQTDGSPIAPQHSDAVEWCVIGGTMRAAHDLGFDNCSDALDLLADLCGQGWAATYNNTHTKKEVLNLVDRAITYSMAVA